MTALLNIEESSGTIIYQDLRSGAYTQPRCYLQTELGHGSNVNALETTATYMKETGEFEINSPTFTSRKWWIGAAGKLATHGVIQAKLILPDGRDMGPHLFFIQIRSMGVFNRISRLIMSDVVRRGSSYITGYHSW